MLLSMQSLRQACLHSWTEGGRSGGLRKESAKAVSRSVSASISESSAGWLASCPLTVKRGAVLWRAGCASRMPRTALSALYRLELMTSKPLDLHRLPLLRSDRSRMAGHRKILQNVRRHCCAKASGWVRMPGVPFGVFVLRTQCPTESCHATDIAILAYEKSLADLITSLQRPPIIPVIPVVSILLSINPI